MNRSYTKHTRSLAIAAALSASPTLWAEDPVFTFTALDVPISENFNTYQGTEATLPSGISTSDALGPPNNFQGIGDFNDPASPGGNFSANTSNMADFSFGIQERTPTSAFQDARVFLPIKNNTGAPIRYFQVSYDVEAWFIGSRRNRIRLKYDNFLTLAEAGRSTFEVDIFSTDNPSTSLFADTGAIRVNGALPENRVKVEGIIDLETLGDGTGNFFGALPAGESAWFRWQFSNTSGDSGSPRSGLAINNLVITPIEGLPDYEWKPGVGGDGAWEPAGGTNWSGGSWLQGVNAVFADAPGVVTLGGNIEAFSVLLQSGYTLDAQTGSTLFAPVGVGVETDITATLNAPIRGDGQLRKLGGGTLLLGGAQNHTGNTDLTSGILRMTADDQHSPNAALVVSPGATFDLNGTSQTTGGLNGERGGLVNLGTGGTLVLDIPVGNFAYRADMEGAGNVVKRGPGIQRFRSEKKLYTGFTRIEEGVLEVTANGEMSATSFIDVMPDGELFLVGGSTSGSPSDFGGPIQLQGGRLATEDTGDVALFISDFIVDVKVPDSTINVSGSQSAMIMTSSFGGVLQGDALVRKTGTGALELGGTHPHTGGMEILNGSLLIASGSSLGAGAVTVGNGAAITGTGTIGGSLALLTGGTLATDLEISGPLNVSGAFSAEENALVSVSGTLLESTFTILTAGGGITGADQLEVTGLAGTGFTGTLEVVGNDLLLHLAEVVGITFAQWAGAVPPTEDVNGNGFPALLEFAFGADAPGGTFTAPVQGMAVYDDVEYLTITAIVRTNSPDLVVTGETSTDLGTSDPWISAPVEFFATGNSNVPPNTEERIYRTPMIGAARFIRLRATESPAP